MTKKLSKEEIISLLAENLKLPEASAKGAVDHLVEKIKEYLSQNKEISVNGFGAPITIRQKSMTDSKGNSGYSEQDGKNQTISKDIKTAQSQSDQRKMQRRNFILDIEIIDRSTGSIIGDMGDITSEGIMVVSEEPIAEKKPFSLEVQLPKEAGNELSITFDALSIRCQETIHENIYITGFKITSLDDENKQKIELFIREYAV
jgi:Bacterial DNA-binding protein/PilZ domain